MMFINLIFLSSFINLVCSFQPIKHNHHVKINNSPRIHHDSMFRLFGKKDKRTGKPAYSNPAPLSKSDKQSRQDKFDAVTRKFMYTIQDLIKRLPDGSRTILKNINLCFYPGAKIGVVGLNGSGKSSLLKIMAGLDKSFDGLAVPMPGISIGYLPQEPNLAGATVMENINLGVKKQQALIDRFYELSARCSETLLDNEMDRTMNELADIQSQIDAQNLWELDRMKERAMIALQCPDPNQPINILSGGEKRRVALARLLLENHDLLLLDEPTNHLDANSVAWLEMFLQDFKGTVVAITHDRYFLENSCGWILELDRGEGIPHEGNYSSWLEKRKQRMEQEKKQDDKLMKSLLAELEWVRSNAKARQTKSKAKLSRYEELLDTPQREAFAHATSIYIPPGPRLGDVVVEAKGVCKSYDRLLIKDMDFEIPAGAIVGVVGPNGAGKSTLIKMIQGLITPDSGTIRVGDTVNLAVVDQEREGLHGDRTVYDEICDGRDTLLLGDIELNSRAYAAMFGFKGGDQQKKVSTLSGGERNRCQLAKVMKAGANVIVLDEPTNDLDVDSIRSLEDALLEFAGCSIIVSHDRYFLDRICSHILSYEGNGVVRFFTGNWQEYDRWRREEAPETVPKPLTYVPLINL